MPDGTILVISQVYVPDPAAVGQYMADAGARMAQDGWRVEVLTSARGYEDPTLRYPRRETIDGVEVRRLPLSSSGKTSVLRRLIGQVSFVAQCIVRGLLVRDLRAVLCTTSPPFGAAAGLAVAGLRRVPLTHWVMDVNPDQAVITGQLAGGSMFVKALEWLNRRTLRAADNVVSLDRFMQDRMSTKLAHPSADLAIVPPWPLDGRLAPIDHPDNPFRQQHGLADKLVFMYSGNHSPVHPLDTLLAAARDLEDRPEVVFVFVGGGSEKGRIEAAIEAGATNLRSLPYQPLERIAYSLSAADVHLVVLGDDMAGIVHPSKVYNAMLVGRPILYIGPRPSHVTDLLDRHEIGWEVRHGDVPAMVETLRRIASLDGASLAAKGRTARDVALTELDRDRLSAKLSTLVTGGASG